MTPWRGWHRSRPHGRHRAGTATWGAEAGRPAGSAPRRLGRVAPRGVRADGHPAASARLTRPSKAEFVTGENVLLGESKCRNWKTGAGWAG